MRPSCSAAPSVAMENDTSTLAALSELASEQKPLMDTIDELRRYQIDRIVDLPQIIVVGDQSSGKSSILSAITKIPFPSRSTVCTRFPIELVLRTSPRTTWGANIIRKDGSIYTLQPVSDTVFNAEMLAGVIANAASEMGDLVAFGEDILRIEICGSDIPHLTLIDLPGFCNSESDGRTVEERQMVERLAHKYMARGSSVILAIVAANNDLMAQSVLSKARHHDPTGRRTLGIITKPDLLLPGNRGDLIVRLARNNHPAHRLELGWHVVRNRDESEKNDTDAVRDRRERDLLMTSPWSSLRNADRGVVRLRRKLSNILHRHIQKNLPDLDESIQLKITEYEERMRQLGEPRTQPAEMRAFLSKIASQYQNICSQAIEGNYSDPFFGGLYAEDEEDGRIRRLRALVRDLNRTFSYVIGSKGSKRLIVQPRRVEQETAEAQPEGEDLQPFNEEDEDKYTASSLREEDEVEPMESPAVIGNFEIYATSVIKRLSFAYNFDEPEEISVMALARELDMIGTQNQGNEFPGALNDMLALHLFRDQIVPWEEIATFHVRHVTRFVKVFVEKLFSHIIAEDDDEPWHAIAEYLVEPFFEARLDILDEKIEELLYHYKHGHPQPLDHEFASIYAGLKQYNNVSVAINALKEQPSLLTEEGRALLLESIAQGEDLPPITTSSLDIIAKCETYYQLSIHTFINNVIVLALENGLIRKLPTIITTEMVSRMDEDKLRALASENPSSQLDREDLQRDYDALKKAAKALKPYRVRNSMGSSPLFGGDAPPPFNRSSSRMGSRPVSRHLTKSSMDAAALPTPPPEEQRALSPEPVKSEPEPVALQSPSPVSHVANQDDHEPRATVSVELPESTTPRSERTIAEVQEPPQTTIAEPKPEPIPAQTPLLGFTPVARSGTPEADTQSSELTPEGGQGSPSTIISGEALTPITSPANRPTSPRSFLGSKKNRGHEQEAFRSPKVGASSAISGDVFVSAVFAGPEKSDAHISTRAHKSGETSGEKSKSEK